MNLPALQKPYAIPNAPWEELKIYLNGISFRWIEPFDPFSSSLTLSACLQSFNRLGISLEKHNTFLPDSGRQDGLERALRRLCRIPKASTYAMGAIIGKIVSMLKMEEAFLNIGVWHGFTFFSGLLGNAGKKCIAVDNFCVNEKVGADGKPEYRGIQKILYRLLDTWARRSFLKRFNRHASAHHRFYEMDYVDYLKHVHRGPIGFYIYDAQHRYKDQLLALELAEPFLAKDAIILIDDTNAADNRWASLDFIRKSHHRYEMLFDQRTYGNRHPTFWNGVMIFRKLD